MSSSWPQRRSHPPERDADNSMVKRPRTSRFDHNATAYRAADSDQPRTVDISAAASAALSLLRRTNEMRPGVPTTAAEQAAQFVDIIDINDSPAKVVLTKGSTHTDILEATGALVVTKGLYRPPGALEGIDYDANSPPPLYLHITAPTRQQLDAAVARIHALMDAAPAAACDAEQTQFEQQIFFDFYQPTSSFNIVPELLGPRGGYLRHIEESARVRVQLRARNQPDMHLFVSASSQEALDKACSLIRSLASVVEKKYQQWHLNPPLPPGPLPPGLVAPPPSTPPPSFLLQLASSSC